jgi:hypothetical protein
MVPEEYGMTRQEPREYEAAIEYRRELERRTFIRSVDRTTYECHEEGCSIGDCPNCRHVAALTSTTQPPHEDPPRPPRTPAPGAAAIADERGWFHTSDGRYYASDADRRAHQRTLDERAQRAAVRQRRAA